jgi:hypothetical protein
MPPAIPPTVSTPPPPPPRLDRVASVTGLVADSGGVPVPGAEIRIRAADARCRPLDGISASFVTAADRYGRYDGQVEIGLGEVTEGCIVVEAFAGAVTTASGSPVLFAPEARADARSRVRIDLKLPAAPPLNRQVAENVIDILTGAIRGDRESEMLLGRYVRSDRNQVRTALNDYRSYLRTVEARTLESRGGAFLYRLKGAGGRTAEAELTGGSLLELRSPLFAHSEAAHVLMRHIADVVAAGDAARLAAVAGVSESEARAILDRYTRALEPGSLTFRLVELDEPAGVLRYRVDGRPANGSSGHEASIELAYDGRSVRIRSIR